MQSINFVNNKIAFVINAWDMEANWIASNGFVDYDFFLYKVFIQMNSLIHKVSPENKDKLVQNFKRLNKGKRYLGSNIPTITQKLQYALV